MAYCLFSSFILHLKWGSNKLIEYSLWYLGLNRLPYANPNKEDLYVKKLKLCQEVLSGMSKFESSYSYLNGILHIELADTLVQKLSQMFSGGK